MNEVIIKKLDSTELDLFIELIHVFEDVFEMKNFSLPAHAHLQRILDRSEFIVFVALKDKKVIGGLTGYVLDQYYSERPLAYLFDLAVCRTYQRQGVGKRLITGMNEYCAKQGFEEVFVQADKVDSHAIEFYRSTNPTEEERVIHFYYSLNK